MRRAFTLPETAVVVAVAALLVATLLPSLTRIQRSGGDAVSLQNLQTLSLAHALYAWDWNDRQVTWVPDEAGVFTLQTGQSNWYQAWVGSGAPCPKSLLLGWEIGPLPTVWGYFLPCGSGGGTPGNAAAMVPNDFSGSGIGGFGSFRLPNAMALHNYVDGRFYSETFYAPTDIKTWELASYGFPEEATFTIPPPLGSGGLPAIVYSSYCLSPAAMWGPEVLSLNDQTGLWYLAPSKSPTGFHSPSVSQCTYPDLKTRMIEHHWNSGQPGPVNPAFAGGYTPYFFNHGLAAEPATLFFDGHVALLPNAQVVADDAAVLVGTGGAVGLWTRDTTFGALGYAGAQSFDGTIVSHHILTAEGILGRDVLTSTPPAKVEGPRHRAGHGHALGTERRTTGDGAVAPVRPPGLAPTGAPL